MDEGQGLPTTEELVGEEIDFQRESIQKLYRSGEGGINPERWERARDEVRFEDVVSELTGERSGVIRCPFHGRDQHPSFTLYARTNDAYCFGCLDLDEPIWLKKGLIRIDDVQVGDDVLDRYGRVQAVYHKEYKQQRALYSIETDNFRDDPLLLTGDHTCIFVRFKDAENYLPFIVKGGVGFRSSEKISKKSGDSRKFRDRVFSIPVTEAPTLEMMVGDYMLFPLISHKERHAIPLEKPVAMSVKQNCPKGPTPKPVPFLPVTELACRLYGLYVAEGSVNPSFNPRTVRWTFNINEEKTLAAFVKDSLMGIFGLKSTLSTYPHKSTCEVICSSVELARSLSFWFGKTASKKILPSESLWWPQSMQRAFIGGYMSGDGDRKTERKASTVSRMLAYSLFAVGIQAKLPMSIGKAIEYMDKSGVFHRESWPVYIRKSDRLSGFFHRIGEHDYYWSRVSSISRTKKRRMVVDISVTGSESFVTKLGAVHNCPPGSMYYDSVTFVSKYLDVPRIVALQWIEKTFELPSLPNIYVEENEECLGFQDLSEPFILKASREIQETRDPELAEDYLRIYFSAVALDKAAKDAKPGDDPSREELRVRAALILAEVLGIDRLIAIAERKAANELDQLVP